MATRKTVTAGKVIGERQFWKLVEPAAAKSPKAESRCKGSRAR